MQRNEYENVMREISILQRLKHPNIVNLFEVINDEEDDYIYLVMEYLSGGSVLSKQQSSVCLEEPIARTYFVDIASGLEYRTSLFLNYALTLAKRDLIAPLSKLANDANPLRLCLQFLPTVHTTRTAMVSLEIKPTNRASLFLHRIFIAFLPSSASFILSLVHANHVIHRDIKPDNIVLTGDGKVAKICDFSVSHVFEDGDDRLSSSAGAPAFLAPELVSVRGQSHGKATDIWALGVTLFYFVFGTCPFLGMSIPAIYERIQHQELEFPSALPNGTAPSKDLQDILQRLLTKDPKKRITMRDIRKHPWCAKEFSRRPTPTQSPALATPATAASIARVKKTPIRVSSEPALLSQSLN